MGLSHCDAAAATPTRCIAVGLLTSRRHHHSHRKEMVVVEHLIECTVEKHVLTHLYIGLAFLLDTNEIGGAGFGQVGEKL